MLGLQTIMHTHCCVYAGSRVLTDFYFFKFGVASKKAWETLFYKMPRDNIPLLDCNRNHADPR